jgi:hypothetical protein
MLLHALGMANRKANTRLGIRFIEGTSYDGRVLIDRHAAVGGGRLPSLPYKVPM